MPYAEAIEATVVKASDVLVESEGNGEALSGTVCVLASDGFGAYLLLPALSAIRRRHPDLTIEVLTSTTHDLLTGRDFDGSPWFRVSGDVVLAGHAASRAVA